MSYIGKKYIANDNSYCLNLSDPHGADYRLAGTIDEDPKEAEIVSEPYEFDIKSFKGEYRTYTFINVKYNGDIIRILFDERWVDNKLEDRLSFHRERNKMSRFLLDDIEFDLDFDILYKNKNRMKNLFLLPILVVLTMSCEKAKINSLEKDLDGSFGVYHYLN